MRQAWANIGEQWHDKGVGKQRHGQAKAWESKAYRQAYGNGDRQLGRVKKGTGNGAETQTGRDRKGLATEQRHAGTSNKQRRPDT